MHKRKKELRAVFIARRKGMSDEIRRQYSLRILDHLISWDRYQRADTVHCYMSIERNGEVETSHILETLHRDGKQVVVPRTLSGGGMEHLSYTPGDPVTYTPPGIPEPATGEPVAVRKLDLILVPMVAADRQMNRLGYGMGYYDRFLASADALKAGLLFEACISDSTLPVESHDERLDYLITEEGIL